MAKTGRISDGGVAALVPGSLRNIALRRSQARTVGNVPVCCGARSIVELCTAHRGVEGRGGKSVYRQAALGRPIERVSGSIASGRSVVTRRDKDNDTLRGSLLPKRIVKGIYGGAQSLLAGSEAHAHDAS